MEIKCPQCDYIAIGDSTAKAQEVLARHTKIQHDMGSGFEGGRLEEIRGKLVSLLRR